MSDTEDKSVTLKINEAYIVPEVIGVNAIALSIPPPSKLALFPVEPANSCSFQEVEHRWGSPGFGRRPHRFGSQGKCPANGD